MKVDIGNKMNNTDTFKKAFDGMVVFSCGSNTKRNSNDSEGATTGKSGVIECNTATQTAFPVLKLVTGGISSRFFGVVPVNK